MTKPPTVEVDRVAWTRGGRGGSATPAVGDGLPGWVMEFETPTAVSDVLADHRNAQAAHPLQNEGVSRSPVCRFKPGNVRSGCLCAMTSRRRFFTIAEMEYCTRSPTKPRSRWRMPASTPTYARKGRELRKYFHRVARALGLGAVAPRGSPLIATLTLEIMGGDRCALYAVKETTANGG
jgi:hypothetical protein